MVAPGFEIDPSKMRYQMTGASQFGLRLRAGGETRTVRLDVPMKTK